MSSTPFEQQAYEVPEIWELDWFPEEDHERVRELATLIPGDVLSLLDVGCGNGLFLNHLASAYEKRFKRLVGVDRSDAALAHVRTEKQKGSIESLPFGDREFDMVACTEVLEHLPVPMYEKALSEIARVAGRWIAISVPYKEDLEASMTKCPACLARFNPDFHVRSFDDRSMMSLFAIRGFSTVMVRHLAPRSVRYDHKVRNWLRGLGKKAEPAYHPFVVCPVCGLTNRAEFARILAARRSSRASLRVTTAERSRSWLRRILADAMPLETTYRWVTALYERNP